MAGRLNFRHLALLVTLLMAAAALLYFAFALAHLWHNRPRGETLFAEFETGQIAAWPEPWMRQLCCAYSAQPTDKLARIGKASLRMELRRSDPDVKASKRAEFRASAAEFGKTYWYGFSVFIPEDWQIDPLPVTLAQWHGVPDKLLLEQGRTPPLRLAIVGGEVAVVSHWSDKRVNQMPFSAFTADGSAVLWRAPLVTGQWTDWLFKVRWSTRTDGEIDLWRNGVRVAKQKGPNAYRDIFAPYFKLGLYVPDWAYINVGGQAQSHTIYFDSVRSWQGDAPPDLSRYWQLNWRPVGEVGKPTN